MRLAGDSAILLLSLSFPWSLENGHRDSHPVLMLSWNVGVCAAKSLAQTGRSAGLSSVRGWPQLQVGTSSVFCEQDTHSQGRQGDDLAISPRAQPYASLSDNSKMSAFRSLSAWGYGLTNDMTWTEKLCKSHVATAFVSDRTWNPKRPITSAISNAVPGKPLTCI